MYLQDVQDDTDIKIGCGKNSQTLAAKDYKNYVDQLYILHHTCFALLLKTGCVQKAFWNECLDLKQCFCLTFVS